MTTVGALVVDLQLATASFRADMNRATSALNSSTAQMNRALAGLEKGFQSVTAAGRLFGVGLGVSAITTFTKSSLAAAAALGDMSDRLGISTAKLQDYRAAALTSGVSTEQMDDALGKFVTRLGQAQNGVGDVVGDFSRLGINVRDNVGKVRAADEVWREFSDRIKAFKDPAEAATAAAIVLGDKVGPRLVLALRQGSAGFDEAGKVIDRWGGRIDQTAIDAARSIENFTQTTTASMTAWAANVGGQIFKGIGDSTNAAVGTALTALARLGVGKDAKVPTVGATTRFDLTAEGTISTPKPLAIGPSPEQTRALSQAVADLERMATEDTLGAQEALNAHILQLYAERQERHKALTEAIASQEEMSAKDMLEAQQAFNNQLRAQVEEMNKANDLKEQTEAAKSATVEWDSLSQSYRVNARELDIVREQQRILNQEQGIGIDRARELATAQVDAAEELRKATAKQEGQVRRLNDAARDFSHAIGTAFEDAVLQGKKFSDILRGLAQDISRIILRLTVTKQLEQSIAVLLSGVGGGGLFSLFGGSSSFAVAGGGIGTTGGGISTFAGTGGTVAAGLGGFASGTDSALPGWHWVGEQGPELMKFAGGEQVLPSDVSRSLTRGGGQTIVMHNDLRGASVDAVARLERFVYNLNNSLDRRVVAVVDDAARRGGHFAKAFG